MEGIKIGEKLLIVKMKETGSIIGHGIVTPRDVVFEVEVAVKSLMERLLTEERGSGRRSGDGAFCPIPECRN